MARKTSEPTARNISNHEPEVKQIAGSTQIIFTMKSFFALMGTILGLFFGFYLLVVNPRIDRTEKNYEKMYEEQKTMNATFTKEITDLKLKDAEHANNLPDNKNKEVNIASVDSSH